MMEKIAVAVMFVLCIGNIAMLRTNPEAIKAMTDAEKAEMAGQVCAPALEIAAVALLPRNDRAGAERQYTMPPPEKVPYSREDAELIAKMLYGECRGVKNRAEKAACAWVVINRCDAWDQTVSEVVTAPGKFYGYREDNPILPELMEIAAEVLSRWRSWERDIPEDVLWFTGDGEHNHFRTEFRGKEDWWV